MLRPGPGASLHLVLGSPAKEALGAFLAEDGAADVWHRSAYKRGDLLLTVLDSKPRMFLCLETASKGSSSAGKYIEVEEVWALPWLVPVAAIEKRIGRRLPTVPGPVEDRLAALLLDALEAELVAPTPVTAREGARCLSTSRARASGLQAVVLQRSGGVCFCCEREHLGLFEGKGLAALEVHHLRPLGGSDAEVETAAEELVAVCGACHNLLHCSAQPSVQDLRYEWRPTCPECTEKRAQPVLWGMPAGPPPEDVVVAGCLLPERPDEWQCASCGFGWREEDEPGEGDEGHEARQMLRLTWPWPREASMVTAFGSDRFHLRLEAHEAGTYEADLWTADGGEWVQEICSPGSMKALCLALEQALPVALRQEGKDPDGWR